MTVLRSKTGDVEMTLRPLKIEEEGAPTWITARLEFREGKTKLLATNIILTKGDLAELRTGLREVSAGRMPNFTITSMDADFIVETQIEDSPGEISLGFWVGEQYLLMKGYRFVATAADLKEFACDLQLDEERAIPPSRP